MAEFSISSSLGLLSVERIALVVENGKALATYDKRCRGYWELQRRLTRIET